MSDMNYYYEIDPLLIKDVQIPYHYNSRLIINTSEKYEEHIFINKIIYHDNDNKLYYHINYLINKDYNINNNENKLIEINFDNITDDIKSYLIKYDLLKNTYKYYI